MIEILFAKPPHGAPTVSDMLFLVAFRKEICHYESMKYSIIIRKSKYGHDVHVPALPGCHSQGDTEKEALENIKDAILTYLEVERKELKGAKVREVEVALPV